MAQPPVFSPAVRADPVLVTGANGYVASWLVRALLDSGFTSVVSGDLALPEESRRDPRARYVNLDVTRALSLSSAMVGVRTVFHCAALVPFNLSRRYNETELKRVNVAGTAGVIAAARAAGVRQLIYVSSTGAVFTGRPIAGEGETTAVTPANPQQLNDAYSASKAAAERLVLAANDAPPQAAGGLATLALRPNGPLHSGLATLALRPNGLYGPGEKHHTPKVLAVAALGAGRALLGAGARTDWSHRDNFVLTALCALRALTASPASRARVSGRAFFATDGWAGQIAEVFAPVLQALGYGAPFLCATAVLPTSAFRGAQTGAFSWAAERPLQAYIESLLPAERATIEACGAVRVPLRVLEAALSCGEAKLVSTDSPSSLMPSTGKPQAPVTSAPPACPAYLAHAAARAASHGSCGALELLVTAERAFPHCVRVPDVLVSLAGAACDAASARLAAASCGLLSWEPFVSAADTRKVLRDNFYSSAAARRELLLVERPEGGGEEAAATGGPGRGTRSSSRSSGVLGDASASAAALPALAPRGGLATLPAEAVREIIAAAAAAGVSGVVQSPPPAVWAAVLAGLSVLALQAYDVGGSVSTPLGWLCGDRGSDAAAALSFVHVCPPAIPTAAAALAFLRDLLWGALLCHALEGAAAFALAFSHGLCAPAWAAQTVVVGFASLEALVAALPEGGTRRRGGHTGRSAAVACVAPACIALFLACFAAMRMARAATPSES